MLLSVLQELLLLLLVNLITANNHACNLITHTNAQVERYLDNAGFHRQLETSVMLSSSESLDSCIVLVKETLPSGAYFDLSQLQFIKELEDLDHFIPNKINVETPSHLSPRITAYFYGHPVPTDIGRWILNISVPIHLRYHRSKSGGSISQLQEIVYINHPSVHLLCDIEDKPDCAVYTQLEPCPPAGHLSCDWLPVSTFSTSEGVMAEVPVGNLDMLDSVLFTTASVTVAAMLLILAAISNKKTAV